MLNCATSKGSWRLAVEHAQDVQFQQAQFTVGNHKEVAAPAGRIKEFELGEALMKLISFFGWPFTFSNSARSSSRNSGPMSLRMFFSVV